MGTMVLEDHAGLRGVEQGLSGLVAEAGERLTLAGRAPVEGVDDGALGEVVTELARVESRAAALRSADRGHA